jgi:hypothetical protein
MGAANVTLLNAIVYRSSLESKYWNYFLWEVGRDCIMCTDNLPNSAVPYCEQYYSMRVLVVWIIFKCLRKDGFVLLMNWEYC